MKDKAVSVAVFGYLAVGAVATYLTAMLGAAVLPLKRYPLRPAVIEALWAWDGERALPGAPKPPDGYTLRTNAALDSIVVAGRSPATGDIYVLQVVEAGWPFKCLVGERAGRADGRLRKFKQLVDRGAFAVGQPALGSHIDEVLHGSPPVPVRPRWIWFVLNVIALGGVAALLVRFAGWLLGPAGPRGRFRQARGRCPMCGYDCRGAGGDTCSECGTTLPRELLRT